MFQPFRVGVVARNPALAPDSELDPGPDPGEYEELVVGLWSGPPVMGLPGQTYTLVSGIQVDMALNPKQGTVLKRQLYFYNPWPGQRLELVITADWNQEISEKKENNNVRILPL